VVVVLLLLLLVWWSAWIGDGEVVIASTGTSSRASEEVPALLQLLQIHGEGLLCMV
jgi:hypothetical protein